MQALILHVWYICKPGTAEGFVRALKDCGAQDKIRAEDGCLRYDYYLSCETADTVLLVEQWRDAASQERHMAMPHMEDVRRIKAEYVTETKLERFA